MSVENFTLIVEKIRPFTNYIYLHVLGEPLLHPQLDELLCIAEKAGLKINITTNGGLLEQKKELLLSHSIRQINISLHDAEENIKAEKWNEYLQSAISFSKQAAPKSYVCLRLWNASNAASKHFNAQCLEALALQFKMDKAALTEVTTGNGVRLDEHIFLQRAPRFEWPDENNEGSQTQKTCYALRDHIAILVDGEVVPCCLDANGTMKLGNILEEELPNILQSSRAKDIKKGFENRRIVEPICATCGFMIATK